MRARNSEGWAEGSAGTLALELKVGRGIREATAGPGGDSTGRRRLRILWRGERGNF
jgi:hypothetical protein